MDLLFTLAGFGIVGWVMLIFLPRWPLTRTMASSALVPLYLSAIYVVGVVPLLIATGPGVVLDFGSAEGVVRLLADRDAALIVWIHLLTFDQAVGVFIYRDNMRHHIVPVSVQSVILFLTLMFGPAGFLAYYAARAMRRRGPAPAGVVTTPFA
jgi:hypothetical protein